MAVVDMLLIAGGFVWELLKSWLFLFYLPVKNFHTLWLIIPIWLVWFFAEFFQEKKGTSFGNAITNGAVSLWAGIDWVRYMTDLVVTNSLSFSFMVFVKYFICFIVLLYGASIIIYGIKAKKFIHKYGRIREVTYILLVFTPLMYGVVDLSWKYFVSIVIFFPIFYYIIEIIDKVTPDPKAIKEDAGGEKGGEDDFGAGLEKPGKEEGFSDDTFSEQGFNAPSAPTGQTQFGQPGQQNRNDNLTKFRGQF